MTTTPDNMTTCAQCGVGPFFLVDERAHPELCLDCADIKPARPTYRERREARAARLEEWADKRDAKAGAALESVRPYTSDYAFNTQPGHFPLRARVIAKTDRAFESMRKAEQMRSKAANITAAAERAIYSDDPDAIDRLTERIAELEAERARVKAFNATCRKGAPDWSILTETEQRHHRRTLEVAGFQCKGDAFPSYHLANLSGNIKRNRDRLAQLAG